MWALTVFEEYNVVSVQNAFKKAQKLNTCLTGDLILSYRPRFSNECANYDDSKIPNLLSNLPKNKSIEEILKILELPRVSVKDSRKRPYLVTESLLISKLYLK